jgi:transaldolase
LTELQNTVAELPRKLDPAKAAGLPIAKISVDKATFDQIHNGDSEALLQADRMVSDKLSEGIDGFTKALISLEKLLAERLARLESEKVTA